MVRTTVAGAVLALPALALAAGLTDSQLTSVSDLLRSYGVESSAISEVQGILRSASTTGATTTPPGQAGRPIMPPGQAAKQACVALTRNLAIGSRGEDVRKVQELLAAEPNSGFTVAPTGYYGPATARAMARWQQLYGVASSSTGSVGPLTRGFFERACASLKLEEGQASERAVMGTVSAVSSDSFTLTTPASTTVTVMLNASTTYKVLITGESSRVGSVADLVVGKTVSVTGPKNADGSIVAHKVTINVEITGGGETRPGAGESRGTEDRPQSMRNQRARNLQ